MTAQGHDRLAGRDVPDLDGLVPACRSEPASVGAEGDPGNQPAMSSQAADRRAAGASQSVTDSSLSAVAMTRPSGLKSTPGSCWSRR